MLQCLNRGHAVDASHHALHECRVKFLKLGTRATTHAWFISQCYWAEAFIPVQDKGLSEFPEAVQTVLKTEMAKLYEEMSMSPVQFNSMFLDAHTHSASHRVSGKSCSVLPFLIFFTACDAFTIDPSEVLSSCAQNLAVVRAVISLILMLSSSFFKDSYLAFIKKLLDACDISLQVLKWCIIWTRPEKRKQFRLPLKYRAIFSAHNTRWVLKSPIPRLSILQPWYKQPVFADLWGSVAAPTRRCVRQMWTKCYWRLQSFRSRAVPAPPCLQKSRELSPRLQELE